MRTPPRIFVAVMMTKSPSTSVLKVQVSLRTDLRSNAKKLAMLATAETTSLGIAADDLPEAEDVKALRSCHCEGKERGSGDE